ncbi:MAG: hypothetical protein IPP60_11035 [Sphingobacteriales bacterium]|nr:hypothetical protein [Sphingobacteriales bacterium]
MRRRAAGLSEQEGADEGEQMAVKGSDDGMRRKFEFNVVNTDYQFRRQCGWL